MNIIAKIKTELTREQSQNLVDWGFFPRCDRELFDLTDLLRLLPSVVTITDSDGKQKEKKTCLSMILYNEGWEVQYEIGNRGFITKQNAELIDAIYKIVIWLHDKE